MKLAVGMPVFQREWCLPLWFDSLEAQNLAPKEDITLCFAYSKGTDRTHDILMERGNDYGNLMIYQYDVQSFPNREDMSRFTVLAQLRNALLGMVKETDADYFLSWDNDIIFEPDVLKSLFIGEPAVGALVDMGGRDGLMHHPSVMHFPQAVGEIAFRRPWNEYPHDKPFKADVIMAVKLMTKEVYSNTEYKWDVCGEDIGWSLNCAEKGYDRWLQPLARGIHLYDKDRAVEIMQNSNAKYPEILDLLSRWYWASV